MVALLLAVVLSGCSVSPERQEALRRAWAEGEAERAQDCQRHGFRYTAGVCHGPGGGPWSIVDERGKSRWLVTGSCGWGRECGGLERRPTGSTTQPGLPL